MTVTISKVKNDTSGSLTFVKLEQPNIFTLAENKTARELKISIPECSNDDQFTENHIELIKSNGSKYCVWYHEGIKYSDNGSWQEDASDIEGTENFPENETLFITITETGILGEVDDDIT